MCGIDADPPPEVEGIKFIRANLDHDDLPLNGQSFGLITAIEVIEHLESPGAFLSKVSRILSPDGKFMLTTPNIHSVRCRLRFLLSNRMASFDEKGDPTHISPLLLPAFRKLAGRHGFKVERCWTYPAKGSLIFGVPLRLASGIVRILAPDPLSGDTLCMLLSRA